MCLDIPHYIKYKSSSKYKDIYNCAISYFITLIMPNLEISKDFGNN